MANAPKRAGKTLAATRPVEGLIDVIRGQKVMLDSDLAALYEVPTRALNQAVRRYLGRFPADFAFQLSKDELENWRSQILTSNPSAKMGLRRPPYTFTQEGVAMLSAVLRSHRAVQMSIFIIRAFIRLREIVAHNKDIADVHIQETFEAIRQLIEQPVTPRRQIGFKPGPQEPPAK